MSSVFSLQGRGLKLDTRADIAPHLEGVDPTLIEEIHFGGNTLGVEASQAVADFLEKTTILKVADFADIFTGRLISEIPQALSAICDALKDKTSLVEIDLSDNAFGGRSVDPMVPFLTTNRSFQILKLNNNGLGPAGGETIAKALLKSAQVSKEEGKPSNLRTVICGRNRLEDGSATAWSEAFAAHAGLVEIKMPQNGIRPDGIASLVRGIAACKNLKHLDLQDNTFGETGSDAMTQELRSWPELEILNLSDCHLVDEGDASAVVETISGGSNGKLQLLQLQNNNLDTQSFAFLAENAAIHLPTLKRLEIQWNEIDDDDEHVASLKVILKKRGGMLIVDDEEDEEEGDEEEEKEKDEKEGEKEDEAPATEPPAEKSVLEKATDALADLMNKVSLGSS